jgi:hypothetical protein
MGNFKILINLVRIKFRYVKIWANNINKHYKKNNTSVHGRAIRLLRSEQASSLSWMNELFWTSNTETLLERNEA